MLFIIVQPLVLGYGQSVGTIVEASDWPEGQEHAAQAVGGREALHGVNFWLSFWACWRPEFGVELQVLGRVDHLGPYPEAPGWPVGYEHTVWAAGGHWTLWEVTQLLGILRLYFPSSLMFLGREIFKKEILTRNQLYECSWHRTGSVLWSRKKIKTNVKKHCYIRLLTSYFWA